jgi:uncharacterized OB-fold protein
MTMTDSPSAIDPRPRVTRDAGRFVVGGVRCGSCGYPTTEPVERCPVCGAATGPAVFGPSGTVFSATVLRVPVPGRAPPYGLAYVDLDDGPRILAHVRVPNDTPLAPNDRVELSGTTEQGDPEVEALP